MKQSMFTKLRPQFSSLCVVRPWIIRYNQEVKPKKKGKQKQKPATNKT